MKVSDGTEFHSEREVETPSPTRADLVFRSLCATSGIHTGFRRRRRLVFATVSFWVVLFIVGTFPDLIEITVGNVKLHSLSELTSFASRNVYFGTGLYAIIRFAVSQDRLEPMLQRGGRRCRDVSLFLLSTVPNLVLSFRRLVETDDGNAELLLIKLQGMMYQLPYVTFLIMFNDVICGLRNRQASLLSLTRQPEAHRLEIMTEKWKIRSDVKIANEFFRIPMALYYAQVSLAIVFAVSELIKSDYSALHNVFLLLFLFSFLLQLLKIIISGSRLTDECHEIEQRCLKGLQSPAADRECLKEIFKVVRFREDWDALQVGYSSMSLMNFFAFLVTSVTCAAVILQFDHLVVRKITQLSSMQ